MGDRVVSARPAPVSSEANSLGGTSPLIMTKIRVPRRRHDLLPRHRLLNALHSNLDRKMILVSAPAGYGKTSLLTDFAHDTDLPVCWYTLDAFDRDLHVFLEHLVAAIARRFPTFGEKSRALLREVTDPSGNLYPIVATVVQEIYDAIPEYFVLILDDHHTVESQEQINEFLDLLVSYVDENLHLILASRTLPALPNLALLVARRQAAGLSIDELRFTPQEVQGLARQNYGLELTQEQAGTLAERTGGWITGLLLTAAPRWERAQQEVPIQGRINVRLYDYLSQQVLDQQPSPLRDFLLVSSVLDELSPDLCTAVLEENRPAEMMDQLRARNLFIIEFEGHDSRLRYHDLFREFLQASLRREDEGRFYELMHRAAQVYADRGEWERAVGRYLALQQYGAVAEIIEQTATGLFETGRWDTLANWIDALPESIRAAHPQFLVHRGQIHMERGEHAPALALYDQAIEAFQAAGKDDEVALALTQKSTTLRYQGQYAEAMAHCRQALDLVSGATNGEKAAMALAHRNFGLCQFRLGQLAEGRGALQQALGLYEDLGAAYDVGMVHHDLGLGHELAGDLEEAVAHYQAALQRWQHLGNPGPWANTLNSLGVIHHLQGEYDQALSLLSEALSKVQQVGDLRVEAFTWASLGDLHRDLGGYEQARQAYTEGLQAATRAGSGFAVTYTLDALGNISRLRGDLAEAKRNLLQAMEHASKHGSAYETGLCHTSLGILASEEGDLAPARQHLNQAIELFEARGFQPESARAHLHRAQAAFLAGDREEALADLGRALTLADRLSFDQFLVVEAQRFLPLLSCARAEGIGARSLPRLLRRIKAHQARVAARLEPVVQAQPQPTLKICALGEPYVELSGEGVQWTTAQSRDLFFCMVQHRRGLRKEEVGQMFWPDHAPPKLDGIFRSTLYRLRRALFRESVVFEEGVYRFNRDVGYWFDLEEFDRLLDQAAKTVTRGKRISLLEEALTLYRGDYLERAYHDWCILERERLRGRYLAGMEALAGMYADWRDLQRATELYQRLLAHDPYQETAHRALMLCYYRLGDRASAIRQYQICVEILREDLGLSPASDTEAVYLQIIS
jgi:LuxR family maltose regulon positive regulatory protein